MHYEYLMDIRMKSFGKIQSFDRFSIKMFLPLIHFIESIAKSARSSRFHLFMHK